MKAVRFQYAWHRFRGTLPGTLETPLSLGEAEFLVLDMETTGLDSNNDNAISLGWVLIQNRAVKLGTARHILLNNGEIDGKNVGIHMITDQDIDEQGRSPSAALRYLRQLLANKILIAHHAPIEIAFLKQLWPKHSNTPLSIAVLDTLALEREYKHRSGEAIGPDGFRLGACRTRYGLPEYGAHDALTDALATAELFLAQTSHLKPNDQASDLVKTAGQIIRLS